MVYVSAVVFWCLVLGLGHTGWARTTQDSPLWRASSRALLPYFGSLAVVSTFFAYLSSRIGDGQLSYASIATLREIEAQIPGWAEAVGNIAPPWLSLLIGLLGLALAVYSAPGAPSAGGVGASSLQAAKAYATTMQWAAALLGAASCFTFFGDGLRDRASDIRREIQVAQVRLQATQDVAVRALAEAVANQAINEALASADDDGGELISLYKALGRHLVELDSERLKKAETRWVQPAQVMRLLSRIDWTRRVPSHDWRSADLAASDFRWQPPNSEQFPGSQMASRPAEGAGAEHVLRTAREDVVKEFLSTGLAAARGAVSSDPVFSFLSDILGAAVVEALKSSATQDVLEPALNKVWAGIARGQQWEAAKSAASELVKRVDLRRLWGERPAASREHTRAMAQQIGSVVRSLDSRDVPPVTVPLDAEGRMKAIRLLATFNLSDAATTLAKAYEVDLKTPTEDSMRDARIAEAWALAILPSAAVGLGSRAQEEFYRGIKGRVTGRAIDATIPRTEAERWLELHGQANTNKGGGPKPPAPKPHRAGR